MPEVLSPTKPIEDVKNEIHFIRRDINKLKTDVICIKADISIIKDYITKKQEAEKQGWIW